MRVDISHGRSVMGLLRKSGNSLWSMKYQFRQAGKRKKRQLIEVHRFLSRILVGMPRDRFQEKAPKMREDQRLGVEA